MHTQDKTRTHVRAPTDAHVTYTTTTTTTAAAAATSQSLLSGAAADAPPSPSGSDLPPSPGGSLEGVSPSGRGEFDERFINASSTRTGVGDDDGGGRNGDGRGFDQAGVASGLVVGLADSSCLP